MDIAAWCSHLLLRGVVGAAKLLAALVLAVLMAAGLLGWVAYEIWRYLT